MSFKAGDIVFNKCQYSNKPIMFSGPILVTKVRRAHIDICYLNNSHTGEPQGNGYQYRSDFMLMDEAPEEWREILPFWVTRAICSTDPNLTMTYEAGQGAPSELERLGLS